MNIEEVINILKKYISFSEKECNFPSIWDWNWHMELANDIENLLTAYEEKCEELKKEIQDDLDVRNRWGLTLQELEKEKEKNKELTERVLKLESDKFWDNVVSKSKIKQIIYPTPENPISIEVQQSEIYKKLLKEVEE